MASTLNQDSDPTLDDILSASLLTNLSQDIESQSRNASFACGGNPENPPHVRGAISQMDSVVSQLSQVSVSQLHSSAHRGMPVEIGDVFMASAYDEAQKRLKKGKAKAAEPSHASSSQVQVQNSSVQVRYGPSGQGKTLLLPSATIDLDIFELAVACQPATFGRGGEDIYDESYRKALKLDKDSFCTDFCPYEAGIIDTVTQVLLPGVSTRRGIRAELYKLNVYSGPSDKFKAHVDTPRGTDQIGSLVVCLPSPFEGGQLAVRNRDREVIFDWSTSKYGRPALHWAAFYSDCEHEVMTVTAGHRITLTYNLYVSKGTGLLAGAADNLNPTQFPLYQSVLSTLLFPQFMNKGGVLGFYLHHSYSHAHEKLHKDLPAALKGVDMVLWESIHALGLQVRLVPVIDHNSDSDDDEEHSDYEWPDDYDEDRDDDSEYRESQRMDVLDFVYHAKPKAFKELVPSHPEETSKRMMKREWGFVARKGAVTWVTRVKHSELQAAYLAYGNESTLAFLYSSVALLVRVPSFERRMAGRA
ncbi:hypothetical protein MBLNU457_g0454t1 [Dothideomycetes sp. NU457]